MVNFSTKSEAREAIFSELRDYLATHSRSNNTPNNCSDSKSGIESSTSTDLYHIPVFGEVEYFNIKE
jgi:hypothetical protein